MSRPIDVRAFKAALKPGDCLIARDSFRDWWRAYRVTEVARTHVWVELLDPEPWQYPEPRRYAKSRLFILPAPDADSAIKAARRMTELLEEVREKRAAIMRQVWQEMDGGGS